ncbi:MAG: hypothetical protein ACOY3P_12190 [Planctomycetota bacterium]
MTTLKHAEPIDQPHSVHELTARLFPAYQVDGGSLRLAGCTLEDRLFARLGYRVGERSLVLLLDAQGQLLSSDLRQQLGLDELRPLAKPPRRYSGELQPAVQAGATLAAKGMANADDATSPELTEETAVWCKYTEGKLHFSIGAAIAELPFAGWSRTLEPPPFVCPVTGARTFHLAATDDGRIVAAEQIGVCAVSGRRVLSQELVECSATGKRALAEYTEVCPVSGKAMLKSELVQCENCRQRVSPAVVQRGRCRACARMQPVSKDDPRMALLLHEHPALDYWRHWRLAETSQAYILTAARWLGRLMVVVDRQSLELRLVASGHRLLRGWTVATPDQYAFVLRDS